MCAAVESFCGSCMLSASEVDGSFVNLCWRVVVGDTLVAINNQQAKRTEITYTNN